MVYLYFMSWFLVWGTVGGVMLEVQSDVLLGFLCLGIVCCSWYSWHIVQWCCLVLDLYVSCHYGKLFINAIVLDFLEIWGSWRPCDALKFFTQVCLYEGSHLPANRFQIGDAFIFLVSWLVQLYKSELPLPRNRRGSSGLPWTDIHDTGRLNQELYVPFRIYFAGRIILKMQCNWRIYIRIPYIQVSP